jgi:hypothetical protein
MVIAKQLLTLAIFYIILLPINLISSLHPHNIPIGRSELDKSRLTSTAAALALAQELYNNPQDTTLNSTEKGALLQKIDGAAGPTMQKSFLTTSITLSCTLNVTLPTVTVSGKTIAGVCQNKKSLFQFNAKNNTYRYLPIVDEENFGLFARNIQYIDFGKGDALIFATLNAVGSTKYCSSASTGKTINKVNCNQPTIALAAHKKTDLIALAQSTEDGSSNLTLYSNANPREKTTVSLNEQSKSIALKWHPTDRILAIKTENNLMLFDMSNNDMQTFCDVSTSQEYDFNEDGTLICVQNKHNCLAVIDMQTQKLVGSNLTIESSRQYRHLD